MSEIRTGACHCGAVTFEVELTNGLGEVRRCNCSLCRKRGALMASVPCEQLRVTGGEQALTLYQWNTGVAHHYFCKVCGIYTHHQRRTRPDEYAFNVACLDDDALPEDGDIVQVDGASLSLEKR